MQENGIDRLRMAIGEAIGIALTKLGEVMVSIGYNGECFIARVREGNVHDESEVEAAILGNVAYVKLLDNDYPMTEWVASFEDSEGLANILVDAWNELREIDRKIQEKELGQEEMK